MQRTRGAMAAVVVLLMLLAGCGTRGAVDDAIERSTAPLLVPTGEWRDEFKFTAPPGSTDLYELRWNFRAGATDLVVGWQVAATSTYEEAAIAEGPGEAIVAEVLRAATDDCQLVDEAAGVRMCSYPAELVRGGANVYLVRQIDEELTLVIHYLNINGDRNVYEGSTLEALFITDRFDRVPIDGDISDYLVYIY